MKPVEAVVFDVGNVLIRWDPLRLYSRLFPDPAKRDWFLATICTEGWNREMDRGKAFAEGIAELVALHPEWERNEWQGYSAYANMRIIEGKSHDEAMAYIEKYISWRGPLPAQAEETASDWALRNGIDWR